VRLRRKKNIQTAGGGDRGGGRGGERGRRVPTAEKLKGRRCESREREHVPHAVFNLQMRRVVELLVDPRVTRRELEDEHKAHADDSDYPQTDTEDFRGCGD